ncbi:acyl carrier protein [Streptomyces sp. NPDC003006]
MSAVRPARHALFAILTGKFAVPLGELTPDTRLSDLELDSLAVAELTLTLRDELHVSCTEEDLPAQATLRQIATTLDARLAPNALSATGETA